MNCGYGFTLYTVKTTKTSQLFGTGLNTDSQIGNMLNIIYNAILEMLFFQPF